MKAASNSNAGCGFSILKHARATGAAGLLFVQVLAGIGCNRSDASSSSERAPVAVEVVAAQQRPWIRQVRATGTLHGDEETTLATKVPGRIVEIMHDLGDIVPAGEPLLQVDPTDAALARDERERAFRETLARLGLTEIPSDEFDVSSLPSVERARLQMENTRSRYERGQSLMRNDPPLISTQDLADMKTALDVAQSNMQGERLSAEATLAQARTLEAQVRIAQQRVADTLHRAPAPASSQDAEKSLSPATQISHCNYEIAARLVSVGDYVQVGAPLFQLVDADPVKLRARVPERLSQSVRIGQQVLVTTEAISTPFEGKVDRISPSVDPQTRTFLLEIAVPNPKGLLKPGAFATALINVGSESVTAVPESSIVVFAGVNKVFVVREGRLEERRVEPGERNEGWVELRVGLEPGDEVVANPTGSMTAGTPARITEGAAQTVAAP